MERKTPLFLDDNGDIETNSISTIKYIPIGGIEQGILVRGQNSNNPVLLILHGGPGAPHIGHARHFQKELEKHFVVINWDQRGAGMSYHEDIRLDSMNLEQFILDAVELIKYIRDHFSKDKIYLIGYSWGSLIGMHLIQRVPEYFYAYFGLSQLVDMHENSLQMYNLLMDKAKINGDEKSMLDLSKIDIGNIEENIFYLQNIAFELGGMYMDLELSRKLISLCKTSGEYIQEDLEILNECMEFSRKALSRNVKNVNLLDTVLEVKVPLYFLVGRHDMILSPYLSEKYLEEIVAPKKELVWFENSAHDIIFSENALFQSTIIKLTKNI